MNKIKRKRLIRFQKTNIFSSSTLFTVERNVNGYKAIAIFSKNPVPELPK
jgi:hypothetical protein